MATVEQKKGADFTLGDLMDRFGPIPARRVRMNPPPGRAAEEDLLDLLGQTDRPYELVDGILVEKDWGAYESYLALVLGHHLLAFLEAAKLGVVTGPDGLVRFAPGLIRVPDLAFFSWSRLPGGQLPREPFLNALPDLAIEVLSKGNTRQEMELKLQQYFAAGVRLVWYVDPATRSVTVYTTPRDSRVLQEADALDGGDVLPGFTLNLAQIFAEPKRG